MRTVRKIGAIICADNSPFPPQVLGKSSACDVLLCLYRKAKWSCSVLILAAAAAGEAASQARLMMRRMDDAYPLVPIMQQHSTQMSFNLGHAFLHLCNVSSMAWDFNFLDKGLHYFEVCTCITVILPTASGGSKYFASNPATHSCCCWHPGSW